MEVRRRVSRPGGPPKGSDEGETGSRLPLMVFKTDGARPMTLLDRTPTDTFHEGSTPVLETERLCLRAPRLEDAKQIAALVNDRRIAENTIRIPHPYAVADAREWIG